MYKLIHGRLSLTSKGDGYVKISKTHEKIDISFDENETIFIDHEHLNCSFHGDLVEVEVLGKRKNDKTGEDVFYGRIKEVLERAKYAYAGKLEIENGIYFLIPDDKKTYTDFIIKKENIMHAKEGDKVIVELISWEDSKRSPFAKVIKVLGRPGDNNAEMLAFALERGFSDEHDDDVKKESEIIHKRGITEEDKKINENGINGRRDFRDITTFTIDPNDAKDFDDAISFEKLENNTYQIGIHIADVSFFLKEDSKMDEEAIKRENSVYLVDRTIPMLPEVLSNDLCSLVQNQDRLVMSAVFVINEDLNILNEWYGRAIINSNKRFTYEDAQNILENGGEFEYELKTLNKIAKKLEEERIKNGALIIEGEEVKFKLDENGKPIDVFIKERKDAHKLIEEFMLLANKKVSKFIFEQQKINNQPNISIYRVHDSPDSEKMYELADFIKSLGEKINVIKGIIPSNDLNKLMQKLKNENKQAELELLSLQVSKTMKKAVYSTENIGHYGLAFQFYSHFTSPIRRYPDVLLHRILMKILKKDWIKENEKGYYERMCDLASKREKEATEAERGSIKYKQVEYMSYRIGEVFDGIISGVSQWGIFVEDKKSGSEGMIRLKDLGTDFYTYNEKKSLILGEKYGESFKLGDQVKIRVKSTNLELKQIDYQLVK